MHFVTFHEDDTVGIIFFDVYFVHVDTLSESA